ncbi:transposable element Tc3 transposase [Trichonephila clavipes]|nr:transposable element Tc3 transposase [Trichonephila clavipes]
MKSLVFETPVNSAEELVARISAAAGEIRNTPEMLSNVRRSMKRRCEACITCGGRHGRIIGRLECGQTQLKVSEELGITQSVISRLWQRFQDEGNRQVPVITKRTPTERHRYGGAGWLVWGGIIFGSRTDLHVQMMTGHIYRDDILEQHVRLFRGAMGAEFLFMDDNAHPHRANIVDEYLQSEDITRMDWTAYSPDLNPIEHVWDMLGRRIAARQPPPTCLPELRKALLDEWCNIPQDQIDHLILSVPRRCKACIASSGRHTPY